jgi:hypothetical protein
MYRLGLARQAKVDYEKARDAYLVAQPGKDLTLASEAYRKAQVVYRMACIEFFEEFEQEQAREKLSGE